MTAFSDQLKLNKRNRKIKNHLCLHSDMNHIPGLYFQFEQNVVSNVQS